MAQKFEFTAKTVEEAVSMGLAQLGLTKETAEIEVLEEGGKGFIIKSKAKVAISKKESDGERAVAFIDTLLAKMNYTATAEIAEEDEKITINLVATNSSSLIGYRGEVLDAIQTLAGAVANIGRDEYRRVVVDCENYRAKREETLKSLAKKVGEKAVKLGRKVKLEPMTPYERRIIHSALAENTEVKTTSEGKEPNRFIVVIPNNLKVQDDKKGGYNRDRKFDRGDRKGRGDRDGKKPYGDRNRGGRPAGGRAKKSTVTSFEGFGGFIGNSLKDE